MSEVSWLSLVRLRRPAGPAPTAGSRSRAQVHAKLLNSLTPDQLKNLNKEGVREQIGTVVERLIVDEAHAR